MTTTRVPSGSPAVEQLPREASVEGLLGRVLVDESHRQAWTTRVDVASRVRPGYPADASYGQAAAELRQAGFTVDVHTDGPLDAGVLSGVDVLVLPHCALDQWEATVQSGEPVYTAGEIDAVETFVRAGGGLVVLVETEQAKYGNNLAEVTGRFGIDVVSCTVQDPVAHFQGVATWPMLVPSTASGSDVFAGVTQACLYRAGTLTVPDAGRVFARTSPSASPADAPVIVGVPVGAGRVLVVADSDFAGDDSIDDLDHRRLWRQLVLWTVAGRRRDRAAAAASTVAGHPAWEVLAARVEALRPLQTADGSVAPAHVTQAQVLVDEIVAAVEELAPLVPHQAGYVAACVADFRAWQAGGLAVPDFLDSLREFRPESERQDGVEHLAVFPMYTQNGNPDRNVEAVVVRTVWPDWVARVEASGYDNAAFVPIEFVAFTSGYDTHSAVLFPETVAAREVVKFTWGGIFCDREAARFRLVSQAACERLRLALPPAAELLLSDQRLAQETFVLWDLVHDRTHSHGDLPFDPFMIKQRMPYWMYALEELRCDLVTFREMGALEERSVAAAPLVRFAILFDRLFRFPVTGGRVRNYDGLAGQIVFAWLHKAGVVRWTDNELSVDWVSLPAAMDGLCSAVERLYRDGIGRSRFGHWLAGHEFVAELVAPTPQSVWARGAAALPDDPAAAVAAVYDDEFPLSVFYESLHKALSPTVEAARGITGMAGVRRSR